MDFADRLQHFGTNVFADMDRAKATAIADGKTIIDLSLGSSDLAPDRRIIEAITTALHDGDTYGYLLHHGTLPFRQAVAAHYTKTYGVEVDPETEVLPLIGSQEGTAHFPLTVMNPGDYALLLDPGYPSHAGGVHLAGGRIHPMPLTAEHNFLPQFSAIPQQVLDRAKMMVLSYPHNPTTGVATLDFFQEALALCERHGLVLVHDFPYGDFYFENCPQPPSILQVDRDKTRSIEFFTFSKSFNLGGFRLGYAIGNPQLIGGLKKIKAAIDFNQYLGILQGAIVALDHSEAIVQKTMEVFRTRRNLLVKLLGDMGWQVPTPKATMYVWAKLPQPWDQDSINFCTQLVQQTGVALSAGAGFGPYGEGYVRFALVHDGDILKTASQLIGDFMNLK